MTYLSRIRINPLRSQSRELLASPGALHRWVAYAIPGSPDEERVLWRLDSDNPHRPQLFALTRSRPDWTHLVDEAGWPASDGEHAVVRPYQPLLDQIAVGREFAFRLTANPVQNTVTPVKPTPAQATRLAATLEEGRHRRGFRLAHRTAAAQLDWFLSRTERWGFDVPSSRTDDPAPGLAPGLPGDTDRPAGPAREVRIVQRRRHTFEKRPGGPRVTFHSATFEGRLRITDTAAFSDRLLDGIGPSKAYGCGLLTLAPLAPRKD
jgi:CRISPR system Cascade subunit CasE